MLSTCIPARYAEKLCFCIADGLTGRELIAAGASWGLWIVWAPGTVPVLSSTWRLEVVPPPLTATYCRSPGRVTRSRRWRAVCRAGAAAVLKHDLTIFPPFHPVITLPCFSSDCGNPKGLPVKGDDKCCLERLLNRSHAGRHRLKVTVRAGRHDHSPTTLAVLYRTRTSGETRPGYASMTCHTSWVTL